MILSIGIGVSYHVFDLLRDAGLFQNPIETNNPFVCDKIGPIQGPEDIERVPEKGFLISSNHHAPMFEHPKIPGKIFFLPIRTSNDQPYSLVPLRLNPEIEIYPHGIDYLASNEGEFLFLVNHLPQGDRIEKFLIDWSGFQLVHQESFSNPLLVRTNDVVAITPNQFYSTHEFSSEDTVEMAISKFLRRGTGYIALYKDEKYSKVYSPLFYANGIEYDKDGPWLYVAEMLGQNLWKFRVDPRGGLQPVAKLPLKESPDNLTLNSQKNTLLVGAHPHLLQLKSYSENKAKSAPAKILSVNSDLNANSLRTLLVDDGSEISAASVAIGEVNNFYLGNIYQDRMYHCRFIDAQ